MKVGMERTNSAVGHINSRFRSCQKAETLDTMVLAQEWMKELSSRADAPRGLVDLQAWRVVVGDDGGGEWWGATPTCRALSKQRLHQPNPASCKPALLKSRAYTPDPASCKSRTAPRWHVQDRL